MKIYNSYENLPDDARHAVVAIGNFDGVHRGHRFVLEYARGLADREGCALAVLTFEPHPRALFRPDEPPARLTPFDLKAWALETCGVDILYAVPFDWDFASQSAEDFITRILQKNLMARHIVVGEDFRFGQMRKGTPTAIEKAGIPVGVVKAVTQGDDVISSSTIREALRQGDIDKANELLGWPWEMRGKIVKGDQRGRVIGYPTANFALGDLIHPAFGIYAALVQIEGENLWRKAAVNIGIRPMFEVPEARVESYIFNFSGDIYGKILRVRPVKRIRSEARFDSLEDLVVQIDKDCVVIKDILKECD